VTRVAGEGGGGTLTSARRAARAPRGAAPRRCRAARAQLRRRPREQPPCRWCHCRFPSCAELCSAGGRPCRARCAPRSARHTDWARPRAAGAGGRAARPARTRGAHGAAPRAWSPGRAGRRLRGQTCRTRTLGQGESGLGSRGTAGGRRAAPTGTPARPRRARRRVRRARGEQAPRRRAGRGCSARIAEGAAGSAERRATARGNGILPPRRWRTHPLLALPLCVLLLLPPPPSSPPPSSPPPSLPQRRASGAAPAWRRRIPETIKRQLEPTPVMSRWPSGLRRQLQVLVFFGRRGFESHP
jgi:hypothetical protein